MLFDMKLRSVLKKFMSSGYGNRIIRVSSNTFIVKGRRDLHVIHQLQSKKLLDLDGKLEKSIECL